MPKKYENRTLEELRSTPLYKLIPPQYKKSKLNKTELIGLLRKLRQDFEKPFIMGYVDKNMPKKKYTLLSKNNRHKILFNAIKDQTAKAVYNFILFMSNVRYPNHKDYKLFLGDSIWVLETFGNTIYWHRKVNFDTLPNVKL